VNIDDTIRGSPGLTTCVGIFRGFQGEYVEDLLVFQGCKLLFMMIL